MFAAILCLAFWCTWNVPVTTARQEVRLLTSQSCGCSDLTGLRDRLRAVEAAAAELEKRREDERWAEPFSQNAYQNQLIPFIERAMGATNSGTLGKPLGSIDPASCAVRPDTSRMSACLVSSIAKNLEIRKAACENWRTVFGRSGTDYRSGNPMAQIVNEEIDAYQSEADFIKEELLRLEAAQCRNARGSSVSTTTPPTPPGTTPPGNTSRPNIPQVPIPTGVVPPGTIPPGQIPPGGLPIGIPPGGPPTGPPPALPPLPPPDNPPVQPPGGTGGPIGVRQTSGYVRYHLDVLMAFPGFGYFKYKANSRLPFTITQNRVTGGGTIVTEIDTSSTPCTASNFDGTVEVSVTGRQAGNYMDVVVTRVTNPNGPSFAEKVANIRLDCKIDGADAFAFNQPNPMSNLTPAVRQRLPLPPVGGPPTTTTIPLQLGIAGQGRIVLRVYRP